MTVAEEFEPRGTMRGGTLILSPADAVAMVEVARDRGVCVLGVDGFWITATTTQPDLEHTLFSGRTGEDRWSEAVRFIREREKLGLMFEVVLDE